MIVEGDDNGEFENLSGQEIITKSTDPNILSLYQQYKEGDIDLQPDFQRQFVWDKKKASALIESILLEIPLPVVYLAEDDTSKLTVIDGQQRLTSIFGFYDGKFPDGTDFRLSSLKVLKQYNKMFFKDLPDEIKRKFKNYTIRTITISKNSGKDIKFDIFERLNSGSVALNDMELRNCIYRGKYIDFIKELSKNSLFRKLVGLRQEEKRMKDVELVLRFLAFSHTNYLDYSAPIKKFLNEDCEKYKNQGSKELDDDLQRFKKALELVNSLFGEHSFKRYYRDQKNSTCRWEDTKFNVSLFDIFMWVFSRQDKNKVMRNADLIREATMDLMVNSWEFEDAITKATSGNKQVQIRFDMYRKLIESILDKDETQERCFSLELKKEMFEKNPVCAICGQKIMNVEDAAIDHIQQFWMGGTTTPDNARLTHRFCNNSRSRKETPDNM